MSRNYEVQVELAPCSAEEKTTVVEVLRRWGMTIECDTESFDHEDQDGWAFWGSIQLTAGQTEEDRHQELRKMLPRFSVTSRWRWVDDQPWDETFITEPVLPAA